MKGKCHELLEGIGERLGWDGRGGEERRGDGRSGEKRREEKKRGERMAERFTTSCDGLDGRMRC